MIHPWGGYYFSIFFINKFFESPPIKRLQNICLKMNFSFRNQFHGNPNKEFARKINFQIRNSRIETFHEPEEYSLSTFRISISRVKKKKKTTWNFRENGRIESIPLTGGGWILRNGRSATLTTRWSFTATSFAQSCDTESWMDRSRGTSFLPIFPRVDLYAPVAPLVSLHRRIQQQLAGGEFSCGPRARPIA